MIVFPLIALLASAACTATAVTRYRRSGRTHELVWTAAFALFALGAACEVLSAPRGWNPFLARLYYFSGATLVAAYLGLGTLYLLAPRRVASAALTGLLLASALAGLLVAATPVNAALLRDEGWAALEKGPALIVLTISLNVLGTLVVVGGALLSAWRAWHGGWNRRVVATLLIAAGTLVVASGGTLTRLGQHSYLYLAMAPGVCLLLVGYLLPDVHALPRPRWPWRRAAARPALADADHAR
ncbi:MAG TPA: hypothetical protein VII06_07980 [Chloroflexota bacterium]